MALKVTCPACGARLGMAEPPKSGSIRCAKCQSVFAYPPKPVTIPPPVSETVPMPVPRPTASHSPAAKASPLKRKPLHAAKKSTTLSRFRKPSPDDAEEATDDALRQRKKKLILVGAAAAAVLLVGVIVFLATRSKQASPTKPVRPVEKSPIVARKEGGETAKPTPPPPVERPRELDVSSPDTDNEAFRVAEETAKKFELSDPVRARTAYEEYLTKFSNGKNTSIALREIEAIEQRHCDEFGRRYLLDGIPLADARAAQWYGEAIRAYQGGYFALAVQRLEVAEKSAPPLPKVALRTLMKYCCFQGIPQVVARQDWIEAEKLATTGLVLWNGDARMCGAVIAMERAHAEALKKEGRVADAIQAVERGMSMLARHGASVADLEQLIRDLKSTPVVTPPVAAAPPTPPPEKPVEAPAPPPERPRPTPSPVPTPAPPPPPVESGVDPRVAAMTKSYLAKIEGEVGWKEEKTDRFRILVNSGKPEHADELRVMLEGIHETFTSTFAPATPPNGPMTVVAHKSLADFRSHNAEIFLALKTDQHPDLVVGFIGEEVGLLILNKLAAVHIFDLTFPEKNDIKREIPAWFREGIGDSFMTSVVEKGKFEFNSLKTVVALTYLSMVCYDFDDVSIVDILNYDEFQFVENTATARPVAWAFCYFLWHQADKGGKKEYEGIVRRLAEAFKEGKTRKEAYEAAFRGIDYHALTKDFLKYIRQLGRKDIIPFAQTFHVDYLKKQGNWKEVETKNYRIMTNSSNDKVLSTMSEKMELMFQSYKQAFKPTKMGDKKSVVIVHGSREDYVAQGGPEGSAAYYNPLSRVLVGYYGGDWETVINFFYHEGTHQFFDLAFPDAFGDDPETGKERVPTWFSEGIADCFGACRVAGGTIFFNSLSSPVGRGRLTQAKNAITIGQISLEDLLNYDKEQFYKVADRAYPLAWSFCYFLWNYPDTSGKGECNGDLKVVIVKLVDAFKSGKSKAEAYKSAFGKLNLDALEKEWLKYIAALPIPPER